MKEAERFVMHPSTMTSACHMDLGYRLQGFNSGTSSTAFVGTVVHRTIAEIMDGLTTLDDTTMEIWRDTAAQKFELAWAGGEIRLNSEERKRDLEELRFELKGKAIAYSLVWARDIAPNVALPMECEKYIRVSGTGLPFDLGGTLDGLDANWWIRDTKNTAQKLKEADAAASVQFGFYSMLVAAENGGDTSKVQRVAYDVVYTKLKEPKGYTVDVPAPTRFDTIIRRATETYKMIEAGVFPPVDPTGPASWKCSEKWCGFYEATCPYGAKGRVQA